jgi:hypothetical protein
MQLPIDMCLQFVSCYGIQMYERVAPAHMFLWGNLLLSVVSNLK